MNEFKRKIGELSKQVNIENEILLGQLRKEEYDKKFGKRLDMDISGTTRILEERKKKQELQEFEERKKLERKKDICKNLKNLKNSNKDKKRKDLSNKDKKRKDLWKDQKFLYRNLLKFIIGNQRRIFINHKKILMKKLN